MPAHPSRAIIYLASHTLPESHQNLTKISWTIKYSCGPPEVNFESWANGKKDWKRANLIFRNTQSLKLQLIVGEHRPIQKTKKRHFHKNQLFDKTKILGAFSVPYLSMLGRVDSSCHFPET